MNVTAGEQHLKRELTPDVQDPEELGYIRDLG